MSTRKAAAVRKPRKRDRKFFQMSFDDMRGGPPGLVLLNQEVLAPVDGVLRASPNRGFPDYLEPPRFLFDRRFGRPLIDLELFHDYCWSPIERRRFSKPSIMTLLPLSKGDQV